MSIRDIFIDTIANDKRLLPRKNKKLKGSFKEVIFGCIDEMQSFSIRCGNTVETCFVNYLTSKGISLIESPFRHDKPDLYFIYNGQKFYFEMKNNINLDTEKTISVANKILRFQEEGAISGCLTFNTLSTSFDTEVIKSLHCKEPLASLLYGYNDFFNIFGENLSREEYSEIIAEFNKVWREKYETVV